MDNAQTAARAQFPLFRLLAGSICISFAPIFIKLAEVPPDTAGFYRMFFAAVSLLILLRLRSGALKIPRKPLLLLSACGVFLAVDFMCWHRSIHLVGPGLSTLLGNFQVFFTAVFSYFFLREKITGRFAAAVLLAIAGLLFITGVDMKALDGGYKLGILLGFATALFYSCYIMLIKEGMNHRTVSGVSAMLIVSVASSLTLGLVSLGGGASFRIPDTGSLLALLGAGVVCTTIGWSMISSAIRHVPATIAGLILLLQPTLAFAWDVLLFERPTGIYEVVGILLILSGIFIGSYRKLNSIPKEARSAVPTATLP